MTGPFPKRRVARRRQAGVVNLLAVIFLITVIMTVLGITLTMNASSIMDSNLQSNSVKALLLAESGLENAVQRFSTTACGSLGQSVTQGNGTITIGAGLGTDFDGTTLLAANRCRVAVDAQITGTSVIRSIEAIIEQGGATLFEEHFPSSANFTANWATQVLTASGGSSAYNADDCPVLVCPSSQGGGSMTMATTVGTPNQLFTGYRQRTLSTNIVSGATGLSVTLRTGFRKASNNANTNTLRVRLVSTTGAETELWSNTVLTTATWVEAQAVVTLPANLTFDRIRLYFNLAEQGNNEVFAWFDAVTILGVGGTAQVVGWREVVR